MYSYFVAAKSTLRSGSPFQKLLTHKTVFEHIKYQKNYGFLRMNLNYIQIHNAAVPRVTKPQIECFDCDAV